MAINALRAVSPEWFEPERYSLDKEGNLKELELEEGVTLTGFKIRPLTNIEFIDVLETPGSVGSVKAFKHALVDWRNMFDENGEEIEFSLSKALKLIPGKYLLAVGNRIVSISDFSGAKQKN